MSDSWLSKNSRPLGLLWLLVTTSAYVFVAPLYPPSASKAVDAGYAIFTTLDMAYLTLYVSSRGLEKYQQIKSKKEAA